ncbi:MAG: (d)CMP kinase [Verrucomicrobiota bacterium]|nr:(d)CMP kinase [Verrucomicrobiota bacterium]
MIIVIDGPAGTGKSTVARQVARRLGFSFFNTGALYRLLALWLQKEGISGSDQGAIAEALVRFTYEAQTVSGGERRYFLQGEEVTNAIRAPDIALLASEIALYPEVRQLMTTIQRDFGQKGDAVFEGRDMGTVVFPDARVKIFLTASSEVRAQRRYEELLRTFPALSDSLSFEKLLAETKERDLQDTTRALAPLKPASDAIIIDTSDLSIDQVTEKILHRALRYRRYSKMHLPYRICYSIARFFFKTCFRLKIYGLEHFPAGAAILAANHASNYDPPVLSISCPEEVYFLAKISLFRVPVLGRLIRLLNARPVSGEATDIATLREIISLLQEGKKVILFPEGARSQDGELQPLARGIGFIAGKAKCPIVPAYIDGSFAAWPRGKRFPKLFGHIQVVFGSLIEWTEDEKVPKREREEKITARVEEALRGLKKWLEKGAKGLPP